MIIKSLWFTLCTIILLAFAIPLAQGMPDALATNNMVQLLFEVVGICVLLTACYTTGKEALGKGM